MNNGNNQKIPCGGFYLGDGLTMEGDTLKSLGGAYIKVVPDEKSPESYKIADDSPLNYETAMKYDGFVFMIIQIYENQTIVPLYGKATDALIFYDYSIANSTMMYNVVNIFDDNSINIVRKKYTLTPAT